MLMLVNKIKNLLKFLKDAEMPSVEEKKKKVEMQEKKKFWILNTTIT